MRNTHRPLTVAALLLSLFMAALEATVVSTAMPTVVGDLGGLQIYSWVFTAYLLTSTIMVPVYGKLADLYGRKPILLVGIALFLLGSTTSGFSTSMTQLIIFRALQGLGAGAMQPMALTIVGDIFDIEERGKMQGLFGAVWAIAGTIGPMAGGVIVHYLSWHWIFFINIPFGIFAAGLLLWALHERVEKKEHTLDILGAAVLMGGVTSLLFASAGGSLKSAAIGLPIAVVMLTLFIFIEMRSKEPLLPLPVFRRPVIAVSSAVGALIGGGMFGVMTYIPLFIQGVCGGTATDAGSAVTPMVISWPIASAVAGRMIMRVGYRPLIRGGLFITAMAGLFIAFFASKGMSLWVPRTGMIFFGMGLGFANTALIIAAQTSVDWQNRGVVTASTMFFRTIGGALAVGVTGGLLKMAIARDPSIPAEAANQLLSAERGRGVSPEILSKVGLLLEDGLKTVFWVVAGIGVVSFLVSLWFPKIKVKA